MWVLPILPHQEEKYCHTVTLCIKNSNLIVEYGSIRQYPVGLNISFQLSPFYLQLNLYFDFMTKEMATNDQCWIVEVLLTGLKMN